MPIMGDKYIWKPSPAVVEYSNIGRFMRRHGIAGYRELISKSTIGDRVVLAGGRRGPRDRVLPAV